VISQHNTGFIASPYFLPTPDKSCLSLENYNINCLARQVFLRFNSAKLSAQQAQGVKHMEKEQVKYRTLVVDPPWDIQQKGARGAVKHYNLMSLKQIMDMPVADLVDPDSSHCWLWVTNATLEQGFDVLRAWGFVPRTVFTWIKPRMGLGVYLRNATEHVLLGTKGKAPILFNAQPNWGFYARQGHSHKPEEFHEVVRRCSPPPYLVLQL
jgi:N6-adenosine-specific RNA methylase IME4